MTIESYADARDQIFEIIVAAWGSNGPVKWPDIANPDTPADGAWMRVTLRHQTGTQATLAGAIGTRRYRRTGTIWMQVFTKPGDGMSSNYTLCKLLSDAFEGVATTGGIWFRNVRLNEVGENGGFVQNNVLVEFEYDDIH